MKYSFSFNLGEAGKRDLANSPPMRAALSAIAADVASRTRATAKLSGYRDGIKTETGTDAAGAYARVYTLYPWAHLDEWGGLMHAAPSRPMRRAIASLGLDFKELGR